MPQLPEGHATSLIERSSNFTLVPRRSQRESIADHEKKILGTIISPLLRSANTAYVYGLAPDTEAHEAAADFITNSRGKHVIDTVETPLKGREQFWIPRRWKARGTILKVIPTERFDADWLFSNCESAWVLENYRSSHNSGAMDYAQRLLIEGKHIVVALCATGSLESITVFAPKPLAFELYTRADKICTCG